MLGNPRSMPCIMASRKGRNAAISSASAFEFLQNPGGQSDRAIRKCVGQRLRLCCLKKRVSALFSGKRSGPLVKFSLLCAHGWCARAERRTEPGRYVVQVNTDDISRIKHAKPCRDARTNVAALGKVSFVAKYSHEIVPKFSDTATVGSGARRG